MSDVVTLEGDLPLLSYINHNDIEGVLRFFSYDHLPPHQAVVSKPFADLALLVASRARNAETMMALRKLLEAKDCAVRAIL